MAHNSVAQLYKSPKTVMTSTDLSLLWQETNLDHLKSKISYYVQTGALRRMTRGVFVKEKTYQSRELGASLYRPSYISFETALRDAGMIFQYDRTIYLAGPWSKTVNLDGNTYTFRKLKDEILYNPAGVIYRDNYSIATPERAFLDMLYMNPEYSFDNLSSLNWERCFELVGLYKNHQLTKRLHRYHQRHAQ